MSAKQIDYSQAHVVNHDFLFKKGLCGLNNLGNTCFMNSIIQCLNHVIPLSKYFLENKYLNTVNRDSDSFKIVMEWNKVIRGLWNSNSIVTPHEFQKSVQELAFKKGLIDFTGFGQNDSQEFLQFFIESMHNCMSKKVEMNIRGNIKNKVDKMAIDALKSYKQFFQSDYSFIINEFYGQLHSKLLTIKDSKSEVSYTYDPFSCISLEISQNNETIYDCFDQYTAREDISSDSRKQFKSLSFWSLPKVLVIFFKRFDNHQRKLNYHIDFPLENLDMSKYVSGYNKSSYKYNLVAVSNHMGGCSGGHYFAFCKNADKKWYKFDDNVVSTSADINKRVVSPMAYCLFYILK